MFNEVFAKDKTRIVAYRRPRGERFMRRRQFLAGTAALGGVMMTTGAIGSPNQASYMALPGTPVLKIRRLERSGGRPVLYIHGATFPSALSVGYRFADGISWEDELRREGFDVWGLDFEGYGQSARPAAFDRPADASPIPLRSLEAAQQIARAVAFILSQTGETRVSIIAHSWGGVPAARYATDHADTLDRLVLFAPPLSRPATDAAAESVDRQSEPEAMPAWDLVTVADQLTRFVRDTPASHANVLAEPTLERWAPAWLASDSRAITRTPPAVQVPVGPQADVAALWSGADLYDPRTIATPTLFVRGEWDSVCSAAEVLRLQSRMRPGLLAIETIPQSGHLAHLENNRSILWNKASAFLKGSVAI
jgi:pimeloyl-ACP methyl ester carboxylesterase